MIAKYENGKMKIFPESGDPWTGETTGEYTETIPQLGLVLRCGIVKSNGKKTKLSLKLSDKPGLAKMVETWEADKKEAVEKEKTEKIAEERGIERGEIPITTRYRDGEYLSGYSVGGYGGDLLVVLELAEKISGWGTVVNEDVIKKLGENFTYPDAKEFARPALEKKEKSKKIVEEKRAAIFAEARRTGERKSLQTWMTNGCSENLEDCSFDSAHEYALPDGKTQITYSHCH